MKETIFGARLRELREEGGLSMKQLGEALEVSDAAICKWENGMAEPKAGCILKLAVYFHCSADYLLGRSNEFARSGERYASVSLGNGEARIAELYKKLPEELRELLLKTAEAWAEG